MDPRITTPIVDQIRELVADIPGWSPEDQLFALYTLAVATSHLEGDIWEIGSWCGRSTSVLALAASRTTNSKITSIDLFPDKQDWFENPDGTFSFRVRIGDRTIGAYAAHTVWREPYERDILTMYEKHGDRLEEIFHSILTKKGFAHLVQTHKGVSSDLVGTFSGRIRFAFIDGDHSYDAVCRDIESVEKFLVPGGWVAFDDAFSYYDGVNRAIEERIILSGRYDHWQQMTRKCFVARRRST